MTLGKLLSLGEHPIFLEITIITENVINFDDKTEAKNCGLLGTDVLNVNTNWGFTPDLN